MACKLKHETALLNSRQFLLDYEAIDKLSNIKNMDRFNQANTQLSKDALDAYGVEGNLWNNKSDRAVPNTTILKSIDNKRKELSLYDSRDAGQVGGNTLFQISPSRNDFDATLDNLLSAQMKSLGVKVNIVGDLKRRFNIDSLGVADTLTKVIHIANQRNIDTLPEEVAHMIVMMLGEHNSDVQYLIKKSKDWSKYQSVYDQYMPVYQNETQVKLEVVAKMIAESTVEVYKKTGLDKSLLQEVYDKLAAILKTIGRLTLGELRVIDSFTYAKATSDKLAADILSGKLVKELLEDNKIPSSFVRMDFHNAFENVPHAKKLHVLITNKTNAKLTGSLALSKQGSIYRDKHEQIHDLDYVVKTEDIAQVNAVIDDLKANGSVDTHFGVNNGNYYTKSILVPVEGYSIIVKERLGDANSKWSGLIQDFSVVEKITNKDVGKDTTKFLNLDFFMYTETTTGKDFQEVTSWEKVFKGKIGLSSSSLIFGRKKDVRDYIHFVNNIENEKAFSNNFTYYQLPESLQIEDSNDTQESAIEDTEYTIEDAVATKDTIKEQNMSLGSSELSLENFDEMLPDFSYATDFEKQMIIDSIKDGDISINCSI